MNLVVAKGVFTNQTIRVVSNVCWRDCPNYQQKYHGAEEMYCWWN